MATLDAEQEGTRPVMIRVLDGFTAESATGDLIPIKNRKACGLLAYLALNPRKSETRERLAGLFWSDKSEEQARASLRQCLKQLRGLFPANGEPAFRTERQEISLAPDSFGIDLQEIADRLGHGAIGDELIYGRVAPDRILYGLESLDQAFGAWLHVVRERWQHRLVDFLETYLRDRTAAEATRERAAQALVRLDSTHEEAQRHLIRRFAEKGNTAAALKQYNELWELLGEEYDMEPAEETQQLIVEIKSGAFPPALKPVEPSDLAEAGLISVDPAPISPALMRPHLPVLGVCPFQPGGPTRSDSYLIEGFRRDLIASLVRFREWTIVEGLSQPDSRGSVQTDQDSVVDYQLEGSFFDDAGELRLVVTLKDASTQRYIWSERYRLGLENWFVAQQELVRRMSVALNVFLSAERVANHIADPNMPEEAYDLWLRGQNLMLHWRTEARSQAELIFRQIIAETPSFAPAYSGLASIYNTRHIVAPGTLRSAALEEEATRYAQQAVTIDPLDTRGQLALAWSNAMRARYDQAELYYNLSHELNASNPTTLISCAQGLAFCGRYEAAGQLADQAIAINPLMPPYHWGYLVGIGFLCTDYARSVEAAENAQESISNLFGWKAAALAMLGRRHEADQAAQHFLDNIRDTWAGDADCTDEAIVAWFLHSFPIKNREARARLKEGLKRSGLPVPSKTEVAR